MLIQFQRRSQATKPGTKDEYPRARVAIGLLCLAHVFRLLAGSPYPSAYKGGSYRHDRHAQRYIFAHLILLCLCMYTSPNSTVGHTIS